MERKRIEKIINKLDDIYQTSYDDEFNVALYVFVRYGLFEFNNYICDDELEEISKILKRHSTIFDGEINDEVSMILNDTEEN
mgnify:CR=1 FL=1